jgi:hypothetical protein
MKKRSGTCWVLDKVEEEQEMQSELVQQPTLNAHPMVMPRFVSNALYITDLDPAFVTEGLLFDLFSQVGTVLSVRLCTNSKSSGGSSLSCHAYVNFNTVEEGMSKETLHEIF